MMRIIFLAATLFLSISAHADMVHWTAKVDSVLAAASGKVALKLSDEKPVSPNPSGTEWLACRTGLIYFHALVDGQLVDEKAVDRMMSVGMAAAAMQQPLRVSIERDNHGRCFTRQFYGVGR